VFRQNQENGVTNGNISSFCDNHEEADTLLVLHAIEVSSTPLADKEIHFVTVLSSDTDVLLYSAVFTIS